MASMSDDKHFTMRYWNALHITVKFLLKFKGLVFISGEKFRVV